VSRLEEALARCGRPEIFNTDQGSQFTSDDFTGTLRRHGVMISMDSKGRCMDNIFVEWLWRSFKYEEVYLNAYEYVPEQARKAGKCSPSPTSPQAPQPTKDLILMK
jgi:putative transposase